MRSAPSVPELRVAPVDRADLHAVAELHQRAFPDSAITAFGVAALERYYRWLLEGPHDAALVGAWRDDRLVGFCAGGWFRGAVAGFLRHNRLFLVGRVLRQPSLLGNELIRERMRTALRVTLRSSRLRRKVDPATTVPRFGILAIATDPAVRGSGAGRALMLEAEDRARRTGHRSMTLTVAPTNDRAIRFYEQLGWERTPDRDGAWTGRMTKSLAPEAN